jgi:hypothetical protein
MYYSCARGRVRFVACIHFQAADAAGESSKAGSNKKPRGNTWKSRSSTVRGELGISGAYADWTDSNALNGVRKLERHMDCINLAWARRLHIADRTATLNELKKDLWVNYGQDLIRSYKKQDNVSVANGLGTLTSKGVWYSFEHDTALDKHDWMQLMGLPANVSCNGLSDYEMRCLVGEAFCLPNCYCDHIGLVLPAIWRMVVDI